MKVDSNGYFFDNLEDWNDETFLAIGPKGELITTDGNKFYIYTPRPGYSGWTLRYKEQTYEFIGSKNED